MLRPTASSIWLAFRSSGKRHLLLTGGRGSGKTTMLRALTAFLAPEVPPGVTSWAEPGRGVFLQENATGTRCQVGAFDPALPGPDRDGPARPERERDRGRERERKKKKKKEK